MFESSTLVPSLHDLGLGAFRQCASTAPVPVRTPGRPCPATVVARPTDTGRPCARSPQLVDLLQLFLFEGDGERWL
jgi:hypothetical protein